MAEQPTKKALIIGITGQDGSYLAEFLLSHGYEVHGLVRHVAAELQEERFSRINHILDKVQIHYGDIMDYRSVWDLIATIVPDEIYHLASISFINTSFEDEFTTLRINADATHNILSILKKLKPDARFYFAATSEMFGQVRESPQSEDTPFNPVSPYAISKVAAHHLTRMYRDAYGMYAASGILFNHESPRRGHHFVTRKITHTAAKIKLGLADELPLGNVDVERDWGYAGDYVEAMWLMLQQEKPRDYVVATGEPHSVREFLDEAFGRLDLDWKKYVKTDQKFFRPLEVYHLRGDASRARKDLGWTPRVGFKELVRMMVDADIKKLKGGMESR